MVPALLGQGQRAQVLDQQVPALNDLPALVLNRLALALNDLPVLDRMAFALNDLPVLDRLALVLNDLPALALGKQPSAL